MSSKSPNIKLRKLLKQYGLRVTDCRSQVLSLFLSHPEALANATIEDELTESFDRVTIYRTLRTFLEKGLIHKVLDDASTPKYALCKEDCQEDEHDHEHVHFKCHHCGQTLCLSEVKIPPIQLPQGYQKIDSNLLINGICEECSH